MLGPDYFCEYMVGEDDSVTFTFSSKCGIYIISYRKEDAMLFISVEDFLAQVRAIPRLTREEEKALARRMLCGDEAAREAPAHAGLREQISPSPPLGAP